jgi:predicted DNA-binding transcriptional regulator AlpA
VPKNSIRKIGKHVVTRGGADADAVTLISDTPHGKAGRKPSIRGPPPIPPDTVFLDAPQVMARYGNRSHMWLRRLLARDPTFPRPMKINRLRFWRLDALQKWERKTAAQSHAA